MGKVTFLDFFSGIGGFRMGFENAGMKCMGHVEWDKYAQQSYKAIYGDREGYGEEYCGWDIREVRAADLPRVDVWTFGAPCQDFSIAGQRRGMDGDRSSLIREVFRLIEESEHKPEWLVYENVKGMLSSNRGWDFFGILFEMDRMGYDIEWQIFNSKDWGVPQNRERVYTIGHLRSRGGRKILPITGQGGQTRSEIISQSGLNVIGNVGKTGHRGFNVYSTDGICPTLTARDYKGPAMVGMLELPKGGRQEPKIIDDQGRIKDSYKQHDIVPTLRAQTHGNPPKAIVQDRRGLMIKEATKKGYDIAEEGDSINLEHPDSETRRGRVGKGVANTLTTSCNQGVAIRETDDGFHLCRNDAKKSSIQGTHVTYQDGTSHCLTSAHTPMTIDQQYDRKNGVGDEIKTAIGGLYTGGSLAFSRGTLEGASRTLKANKHDAAIVLRQSDKIRIRKLTPLECWRLQGFPDWAFYRAKEAGVSDSQLYKQAGNSVTVNVTEVIGRAIVEQIQ